MKFKTKNIEVSNIDNHLLIPVKSRQFAFELVESLGDKDVDVEIKIHRAGRSTDANSYMWVLLRKLAVPLKTSDEELYEEYLRKYGPYFELAISTSKKDRILPTLKHCGKVTDTLLNGKQVTKVICYYGSSTYNTKEMAHLIDMIVIDCKEQGIETKSPDELERLKSEWK